MLELHDAGDHTLASIHQYRHLWTWDALMHGLGQAAIDEERGWRHMLAPLSLGQHADGFVPHITYSTTPQRYMPGPERWGELSSVAGRRTSGISNPPVAGICLRELFERSGDERRARAALGPIARWHAWWQRERMPAAGGGSPVSIHPWEGGMDDAPHAIDALVHAPVASDPYVRRDLDHVDAAQRPPDAHYDRYIGLVDHGRAVGWRQRELATHGPYRLLCPALGGLLATSAADLAHVADRLGETEVAEASADLAAQVRDAMRARASADGSVHPVDLVTGTELPHVTVASVLAAGDAGSAVGQRARRLAMPGGELHTPVGLRSTSPLDAAFEPQRYWRGPVWAPTTWLASVQAARRGDLELAAELRACVVRFLVEVGPREYAHAETLEGLGAQEFPWPCAVGLWEATRGRAAHGAQVTEQG